MQKSQYAAKRISELDGVEIKLSSPFFKEFVVNFDKTGKSVGDINKALLKKKIFGGKDISDEFPNLGQSALYCVTEIMTKKDIDKLVKALAQATR
jgi:glycine dehydrogenase subunit 1